MMDMTALAEGLALFKSGMEGLKVAFQLAKDVKSVMPADKQEDVGRALELSEQQFGYAEAQIAKGLGFSLCHCANPPTPMLTVGWLNRRGPNSSVGAVHRCPKCGITDNGGLDWTRTATMVAYTDAALGIGAIPSP